MSRGRHSLALAATLCLALAAPALADTQSHRLAAWKLLQAMHFEQLFDRTVGQLVDFELNRHPQWAPYAPVLRHFFTDTLDQSALQQALIGVYTARFTEQELNDISAFYNTETGQKLLQQTPALAVDIARIARQQVNAQQPALHSALEAAIRKAGRYQTSPAS